MSKGIGSIIPKISGMEIPLELYRKTDDGKTQKAVITIRELFERYSIVQQLSEVIFANHTVEEFDINEINEEIKSRKPSTIPRSGERITITPAMAELIKKARTNAGFTQDRVTSQIDVSNAFSNIVERARGDVNAQKLQEYCNVIGLDYQEVLALQ